MHKTIKVGLIQKFTDWFFTVPEGKRSLRDVILWWEIRRIPYNLIVGSVGLVSLVLFYVFIKLSGKLGPADDPVEPFALLAVPFLINVGYSAGWVVEALFGKAWADYGEPVATRMLKFGLGISLLLVLIPSVFWGAYLLVRFWWSV